MTEKARSSWTVVLFLALSCGGSPGTGDRTALVSEDPPEIRSLVGYESGRVVDPVFGGEVYVMEAGPPGAPPVVLVHGLGEAAARDWYGVVPALAREHRVLVLDLPGFGRSQKGNHLYSPPRFAASVKMLVESRIKGPFDLIGHSMGGAIALVYASTHPQDVGRLVLVDVAGILERNALVRFLAHAGIDGVVSGHSGKKGVAKWLTDVAMAPARMVDNAPERILESETARAAVLGGDPGRIAALALILENLGPAIDGVKAPTLLIWGKEDLIAPVRTGKVLNSRIANARLELMDHTAHVPMKSQPDRFARLVLEYLDAPLADLKSPADLPAQPDSDRMGRCNGQADVVFEGEYESVEITDCKNATIQEASIGKLTVSRSQVVIEDTEIVGRDVAVEVDDSQIQMTGGQIKAEVGISTRASLLDVAGVDITGAKAAIHTKGRSSLIASVCRIESPITRDHLHAKFALNDGQEL